MTKTRGRPAIQRARMLQYVNATIEETGVAPSYGMICNALGISTRQEVCRIVKAAELCGLLSRVGSGRVRRIRLEKPLILI